MVSQTTGQAQAIARRLWDAAETGQPIPPIRNQFKAGDTRAAYEVQELLTLRRLQEGARVVGHKIGLTSPAVQRQLGVDQPDFGVLFGHMRRREGETIETGSLIAPKIEAEVAFVLESDLDDDRIDLNRVRCALAYAVPALEIVDSRIAKWDISIVDTVADNASSGLFVLGHSHVPLDGVDLSSVRMELTTAGATVSEGAGRDCLGDPLNAVLWLARTCRDLGLPLKAGEVVLSGALGPMVPVDARTTYHAAISDIGDVTARFD